jgi:recombinational DNA repair ATPase RecF
VLFSSRRPRQLFLGRRQAAQRRGASGVLTTVLFCPDELLVLKNGSAGRRKLLDNAICQLRPNYAEALAEYGRLYENKSRILRDCRDNPSYFGAARVQRTDGAGRRIADLLPRAVRSSLWRQLRAAFTANFPAGGRRSR